MLESKIKAIVSHVKSKIPVFGENGFYWDTSKEPANGMTGVTDTKEMYFGIQQKKRTTPDEYGFDSLRNDEYEVRTVYQFIAQVGCVNKFQAVQAFGNALVSNTELPVKILSVSFDSQLIYKSLYNQDYSSPKANLIMIEFSVNDMFLITNCYDLDFCEDCCARTDEGTCWCGCFTN